MRLLLRLSLLFSVLLCIAGIGYAQEDTPDLPLNQDTLLNFTTNQSTTTFNVATESTTTLSVDVVRYLGASFTFYADVVDESSAVVATAEMTEAGQYPFVLPSAGNYTLFLYIQDTSGGRAVINAGFASDPKDGTWQVTYLSNENSCPDTLTLDAVWLPSDGSQVELIFSDPISPLDFHMAVAPEELADAPEFFETATTDAGSYQVMPGLQGTPYTYTYTVTDDETIQLDYLETLNLSDCELTISVELSYVEATEDTDTESSSEEATPVPPIAVDFSEWTILGDASEPVISDNSLCATDLQQGQTWYYDAPQSFVNQVVNGYGQELSFALNQDQTTGQFDDPDVLLVVGNGILLGYEFSENPGTDFTTYSIPITEDGGWYDVDGMFDVTDGELFQQMLGDVTRVQIRGEFSEEQDTGCLQSPMVAPPGENTSASTGGTTDGNSSSTTADAETTTDTTESGETSTTTNGDVLIDGQPLQVGDWLATGTLGGVGCEGEEMWHSSGALGNNTLNLSISSDGIVDNSMTVPPLYLPTDNPNQFLHDNSNGGNVAFRFYLDFTSPTTGTYRQYFISGATCTGAFAFDIEYQG